MSCFCSHNSVRKVQDSDCFEKFNPVSPSFWLWNSSWRGMGFGVKMTHPCVYTPSLPSFLPFLFIFSFVHLLLKKRIKEHDTISNKFKSMWWKVSSLSVSKSPNSFPEGGHSWHFLMCPSIKFLFIIKHIFVFSPLI